MPGMDIFGGNAFHMQTLTAALLDRPHVPMRLGALGIFESAGIRTLDASIEKKGNTLSLIPTTPRGGPATQKTKDQRNLIKIPTFRTAFEDVISADEVQNVRAFGSESELQTLQQEVNDRAAALTPSIDATEEFQRIGAMKGQVLDADASVLIDLFTEFGVSAQSEAAMDIANVAAGALRGVIASKVIRPIEDELGGLPYTGIHAMVSPEFFDDLIAHVDVQDRLKHFPQGAAELAQRTARTTLDFGGVIWEEYRGTVGGTKYVAADKAHAFPVGVPGLFLTRYSPAEYFDTVNTTGLPRYVRMNPEGTDGDSYRTIRVQSQSFHICTRPRTLMPMKRGA